MADSTIIEKTDQGGNVVYLGNIGDLLIPPFPKIDDFRQHARDIRCMEMHPDDVIVVGFPKTGTHWTYDIAHMLMKGKVELCTRKAESDAFLDMTPITAEFIPSADTPRLFSSHLLFHHLPLQVVEKKVKVIYLERNPKDTWVSLYSHASCYTGRMGFEGSWHHLLDLMMTSGYWYGNWFDYVLNWEAAIERETAADGDGVPIFVSHYEDLKKDPVGQICQLDQFLGYSRGRQLCGQIAEACHFPNMKGVKEEDMKEEMQRTFKPKAVGLYRKGEVGDWKNWFTVAQSERFDQQFRDRMKGSNLRYTFQ